MRHALGGQHAISVAKRYDELHMAKSQHLRWCFLTKTSAAVSHVLQALADARSAEQMQVDWLRDQIPPHFTQKLLRCTRDILKWIGAHDSDSKHQFPVLAGSHLPEVPATR